MLVNCLFLSTQKMAYDVRISDWSSDVCSSDLAGERGQRVAAVGVRRRAEVVGEQGELGVARRRVGEAVEQLREALHASASSAPTPSGPTSSCSSSPRPMSASARPLRPMELA